MVKTCHWLQKTKRQTIQRINNKTENKKMNEWKKISCKRKIVGVLFSTFGQISHLLKKDEGCPKEFLINGKAHRCVPMLQMNKLFEK